jgi:hypothetical protein
MSHYLRDAGWLALYAVIIAALVAGVIWPTCAVLALAAVLAVRWVLRHVPSGGP